MEQLQREQYQGSQNKRLFFVEGEADKTFLSNLLSRYPQAAGWESRWSIIIAQGGKKGVLKQLQENSNALGLVDRDEWSEKTIIETQQRQPNLLLLSRYCIENYLINPDEIWSVIDEQKRNNYSGGLNGFKQGFTEKLDEYVRHGVLWKTITPLWSGLRALGFKEKLASKQSLQAAQDDQVIQQTLQAWHEFIKPEDIFKQFKTQLDATKNLSDNEKFALWIHGKIFWEQVAAEQIKKVNSTQQDHNSLKNELMQNIAIPNDMIPILKKFI